MLFKKSCVKFFETDIVGFVKEEEDTKKTLSGDYIVTYRLLTIVDIGHGVLEITVVGIGCFTVFRRPTQAGHAL